MFVIGASKPHADGRSERNRQWNPFVLSLILVIIASVACRVTFCRFLASEVDTTLETLFGERFNAYAIMSWAFIVCFLLRGRHDSHADLKERLTNLTLNMLAILELDTKWVNLIYVACTIFEFAIVLRIWWTDETSKRNEDLLRCLDFCQLVLGWLGIAYDTKCHQDSWWRLRSFDSMIMFASTAPALLMRLAAETLEFVSNIQAAQDLVQAEQLQEQMLASQMDQVDPGNPNLWGLFKQMPPEVAATGIMTCLNKNYSKRKEVLNGFLDVLKMVRQSPTTLEIVDRLQYQMALHQRIMEDESWRELWELVESFRRYRSRSRSPRDGSVTRNVRRRNSAGTSSRVSFR